MGLVASLLRDRNSGTSPAQTGSKSAASGTADTAAPAAAAPRRGMLPAIMFIISVVTLSIGVVRLRQNSYCENPLAVWLIVHAAINLTQAAVMLTRARVVTSLGGRPLEGGLRTAVRLSWLVSGVLFLGQVSWLVVGANWTWGMSSSSCDSTIYRAAQAALIIGFIIIGLLLLLIGKRALDRQQGGLQKLPEPELEASASQFTAPYV